MALHRGQLFAAAGAGGSLAEHQRFEVPHTLFTAAAASESVNLAPVLPAGLYFIVGRRVPIPFTGGTIATATLSIGPSGNTDQFMAATDVLTAALPYGLEVGDGTALVVTAATTLQATLTVTADTVDNTEAGSAVVDMYYMAPTDPDPA